MTQNTRTSLPRAQGHGPSRRTRWPTPVALLVGLLALAAVAYVLAEGPGQSLLSPTGSTVAELSGDGDQTSDAFDVREGWSIHWENRGDRFAFAITGDRDFGTVVEQDESGTGVTSPAGGGRYRLEIQAEGPWEIRIVQGN